MSIKTAIFYFIKKLHVTKDCNFLQNKSFNNYNKKSFNN